jgi:hypothetical protein
MIRKNSQLHPVNGYTYLVKRSGDGGAAQDKTSDKTTSTYISMYFSMEKTDKCNEPQDSSVHWLQNW